MVLCEQQQMDHKSMTLANRQLWLGRWNDLLDLDGLTETKPNLTTKNPLIEHSKQFDSFFQAYCYTSISIPLLLLLNEAAIDQQ